MSSGKKPLTRDEIESIIHYLQRVVPRGSEDADYLFHLLARLESVLDK